MNHQIYIAKRSLSPIHKSVVLRNLALSSELANANIDPYFGSKVTAILLLVPSSIIPPHTV